MGSERAPMRSDFLTALLNVEIGFSSLETLLARPHPRSDHRETRPTLKLGIIPRAARARTSVVMFAPPCFAWPPNSTHDAICGTSLGRDLKLYPRRVIGKAKIWSSRRLDSPGDAIQTTGSLRHQALASDQLQRTGERPKLDSRQDRSR